MARKITVTVIDDVDGQSPADVNIAFGLDGVEYTIDLSSQNSAELRSQFAVWIAKARRAGRDQVSGKRASYAAIRTWAQQNGHSVGSRGRIPAEVARAFNAASRSASE